MSSATPLLLAGNMCDARLWTGAVRSALPGAIDADLTQDDSIEAMAARALSAVGGPVLPVGFSMGGIVALAIARAAPERVSGMILLDTNPTADLPERAAARPRQQALVRGGALERIVVEELKPHYLAPANCDDAALLDLLRDMAMTLGDAVFVRQSEALRTRADHSDVLGWFDKPVLIACGADDRLCPPEWHRGMANVAAHPTLHVVPGAGHMLPLEQPALLAAIINEWERP